MAYEGLNEDPDRLQRQLEEQQAVRLMPSPMNQTQPVGSPVQLSDWQKQELSKPQMKQSMYGNDANGNPLVANDPGIDRPGTGGGNPLGGSNTGVAGGKPMGGVAPMAGGALARYGTADIDGAGDLKAGGYGGEGFSYNERAARGERGANTIKNTFGKIASRYDPTQPGAAKAVMADPDFQRFFPEAKLVEHPNGDLIDFGDGKPVDVLRAARAGGSGEAWQWGADEGGGGAMAAGGGGGLDMNALIAGITGGNAMGGIQSEIEKLVSGQDPQTQTLIQQILAGEVQV